MLLPDIKNYIEEAVKTFDTISEERKAILAQISRFVAHKINEGQTAELNYICTHNSRRSHFGQIWGQAAAYYYDIAPVQTFSGGTEATSFNPNAIAAIKRAGFIVTDNTAGSNPVYQLQFADDAPAVVCFSKKFDDKSNPQSGFAAIMTCSHADQSCPLVLGALRIATTYEDPKAFDNTTIQDMMYDERCKQIARESLYVFSLVKGF